MDEEDIGENIVDEDSDDLLEATEPNPEDLVQVSSEAINDKDNVFKIKDSRDYKSVHYAIAARQKRFTITESEAKNLILGNQVIRREDSENNHPFIILRSSSESFRLKQSGQEQRSGKWLNLTRLYIMAKTEGEIYGYKFKDTDDNVPINFPASIQRNGTNIKIAPDDVIKLLKGESLKKNGFRINMKSSIVKTNKHGNLYAVADLVTINLKRTKAKKVIPKIENNPPPIPYQSPKRLAIKALLKSLGVLTGLDSAAKLAKGNKKPRL